MVFLTGRVYHKTLVLDMIRGAFPGLLCLLGGTDPPFCFFLSPFIVISFFLNRVLRVGTCPISLSLQLLGVVVRTEKYGFARHKALNAVVAAFPLDVFIFSVVFSCFSVFPVLWNNMECRHWSYVASFTLGYIHPRRIPHGQGGIFPWLGPRPNVDNDMGLSTFLPPTLTIN